MLEALHSSAVATDSCNGDNLELGTVSHRVEGQSDQWKLFQDTLVQTHARTHTPNNNKNKMQLGEVALTPILILSVSCFHKDDRDIHSSYKGREPLGVLRS